MTKNQKVLIGLGIIIVVLLVAWYVQSQQGDSGTLVTEGVVNEQPANNTSTLPTNTNSNIPAEPAEKIVAENLKIPWEIVFLPDGSMLVTERPGTIQRITPTKQAIQIQGVRHVGEGGLLGMVLHPDFKNNQRIYLYLTTASGSGLSNRVESYRLDGNALADRKVVIENIPGSSNHDGGRIAFGPDNSLYITTGDAEVPARAQDTNSLAGKILRLKEDGSVPADNPFNNAVYSYGHRNPQGLAWDNQGRLWATEHGRSGASSGYDELNLIEKGKNYGWPTIEGDKSQDGMQRPIAHSGANSTWAPSGLAYLNGSLYYSGLRGESLYKATINNGPSVDLKNYLAKKYGRLRAVVVGSDGYLYISTSNTDGRGSVKTGDDKIIRLAPSLFQ
jgi:glucose/arabinose dehydrogenase